MADVPDFFWKPRISKQGYARASEGPNHFADMDQPGPDGRTLLDLTENDDFIDPDRWQSFYESVVDLLKGDPIAAVHRGLLPFRVWQIFDGMVEFASTGKAAEFVCAAGVLTHYVGDACQPLHISYLHDGDPKRAFEYTFTKGKKAGQSELRPLGQGVHSAYEDAMVHAYREKIFDGLKATPKVKEQELIDTGFDAAKQTIALMRRTFNAIAPAELVQAYIDVHGGGAKASAALWKAYGTKTIDVMEGGAHLLAVLWESAWRAGDGETKVKTTAALSEGKAMKVVQNPDFLPSKTVGEIKALLKPRA
jgi:hypothetical protein